MLSLFPNVFHKGDCPEQPLSIIIQNTLVRSKLTLFDIFNLSVVSKDIHTLCVQPDLILEKVPAPIHLGSRSTALARIKQLIIDSSTLNDFHFTLFNKGVHPPYDAQFIIELIKMWMVYHPDVKPTSNDLAYTLAYFCGGLDFDVWLETATSFGLDLSRMKMSYYFDTDDSLSSDGGDADGEFDLEIDSVYGPNGMWEDVALGAAARAGHTGLVRGLLSMHALGESLYHELDVVCRTAVAFGKIDVLKCMSSFNMVESDSMMVARIILDSAVREGQLEVMQWLFSPKEMGGFGFSPDISTMRMYKRLAVAFVRKCPQKFRHVRQCIDAWLLSKQAA